MVSETYSGADFPLEPVAPFGNLMFSWGGPVSGVTQGYACEKGLGQTSEF